MHEIKWIREHPDEFDLALKRRSLSSNGPEAGRLIELDERRRAAIHPHRGGAGAAQHGL